MTASTPRPKREPRTLDIGKATPAEVQAFITRSCASCGQPVNQHIHLFGSDVYLCPTVQTFEEPENA